MSQDLLEALATIKDLKHNLTNEKKARAKAEKQAEKKSNQLTELEGKYQSAQESLLELE